MMDGILVDEEPLTIEPETDGDSNRVPRRLVVKRGSRRILVSVSEIEVIEAEGNYARLWVGENSYLIRQTMARLEERLRPAHFVRIQRSAIVNVNRIAEIRSHDGDHEVVMASGKKLALSRSYVSNLDETLECA